MVEKLTWARDHKIDPPLYVILEARQQGIDWIAFCAGGRLKQTKACAACCAHCGHDSAVAADQQQNSPNSKIDGGRSQGVVLSAMLKCHGAAQSWLSLGNYVPPPVLSGIVGQNPLLELLGIYSDRADSISFPPALRPPRSLFV